jgi:hypothetical protein
MTVYCRISNLHTSFSLREGITSFFATTGKSYGIPGTMVAYSDRSYGIHPGSYQYNSR